MTIGLRDIYGVSADDLLPAGGTTGQVLAKQSATNGDVDWDFLKGRDDGSTPAAGEIGEVIDGNEMQNVTAASISETWVLPKGVWRVTAYGFFMGPSTGTHIDITFTYSVEIMGGSKPPGQTKAMGGGVSHGNGTTHTSPSLAGTTVSRDIVSDGTTSVDIRVSNFSIGTQVTVSKTCAYWATRIA